MEITLDIEEGLLERCFGDSISKLRAENSSLRVKLREKEKELECLRKRLKSGKVECSCCSIERALLEKDAELTETKDELAFLGWLLSECEEERRVEVASLKKRLRKQVRSCGKECD